MRSKFFGWKKKEGGQRNVSGSLLTLPASIDGFSVEKGGLESKPDPALTGGPTIGPTSTQEYHIVRDGKTLHTVKIHCGQLPPQPTAFTVDGVNYVLHRWFLRLMGRGWRMVSCLSRKRCSVYSGGRLLISNFCGLQL
jgi:hypothetical protein